MKRKTINNFNHYVYEYDYSCMYICAHILHLYVRYGYVQHCEDTVSVESRYIN